MQLLRSVILLCLSLSVLGCARSSGVSEPVTCLHPTIDASTVGGLVQGLVDYSEALDMCNALQGATSVAPE